MVYQVSVKNVARDWLSNPLFAKILLNTLSTYLIIEIAAATQPLNFEVIKMSNAAQKMCFRYITS